MAALILGTATVVSMQFMVVGLVPEFVEHLGIPLQRAAWLVSVFGLSAGIIGPFVTIGFSRGRPGRVLPLILALFGLSGLIAVLWPSYPMLIVVRLCQGALLTPFLSIAAATAAALAQQGLAGRSIGRVILGTVIGSVLAVPAALALAHSHGWQTVFAVLSMSTFIAAICVEAAVPRSFTFPAQHPGEARTTKVPEASRASEVWRVPEVSGASRARVSPAFTALWNAAFVAHLMLSALIFTAMFSTYTYIATFLTEVLRMPPNLSAVALLEFGLAGIAGNWAASQVVDRQPLIVTMVVVGVLVMATALLPAAAQHWVLTALILALWGAAHNAAFVACLVRVMFAAGETPALGGALNISVANVGMAAGAMWGGKVVAYFGVRWVGLGTATVGILALVVGWLLYNFGGSGEHTRRVGGTGYPRLP